MNTLKQEHLGAFLLAGRARFTLVSTATGTRFTYQVKRSKDGAVYFVGVLTGANNESDYEYLGCVRAADTSKYFHGSGSRIAKTAPSALAFAWFWPRAAFGSVPPACEVHHQGCCGRCGRALTVPESIATGLGPECSKAVA